MSINTSRFYINKEMGEAEEVLFVSDRRCSLFTIDAVLLVQEAECSLQQGTFP